MYDLSLIEGNDTIVKSLKDAIKSNRINHAYIFEGQRGMGKRMAANAFAKALQCEESSAAGEACGRCISCRAFDSGNSPDVIYIRREEGAREIKIDSVRSLINKNVDIKPYSSPYKIFIIEEADRMNAAAQNAFLKTLEEPPSYGVFLLTAENCSRLLPTVLSRCQRFKLRPVATERIRNIVRAELKDDVTADEAMIAALYSGGSIGRARELASDREFKALREAVAANTITLLETDLIGLYRLTAQMDSYKDNIDSYMDIMYLLYRDSLVYIQTGSTRAVIQQDKLEAVRRVCALTGTRRLIRGCELIAEAMDNLRRRGDFQLVIENLFFKLKEK